MANPEPSMKAVCVVDIRLQLARALDALVSPGSDLPQPGWPWRWPEREGREGNGTESHSSENQSSEGNSMDWHLLEQAPFGGSAFVREWIEAGKGRRVEKAGSGM
jgi:hypothetical protein